jgi:hypothetical protein
MLEAGGYWRPLAAVARLLEELGELVELLVGTRPSAGDLAGELADLWIITTALADQFRLEVPEPERAPPAASTAPSPAGLVMAAGRIARVVNYYDGPKTPRAPGGLPSLAEAIVGFHDELDLLCASLEVDLGAAVSDKISVIHGRDMERFAREDNDPSTAATLALLPGPRQQARLWGAPASEPGAGPGELVAALVPSLVAFTKAAVPEGLEGYVIGAPAGPGSAELEDWLAAFVEELRDADPAPPGETTAAPGELRFNGLLLRIEIVPVKSGAEGGTAEALVILGPCDRSMPV